MNRESGFTYLELLVAALVLAISAVGALASWSYSSRAPANKRATEMAVYVATQQIERLKARRYMGLQDYPDASPLITYYDRYGGVVTGAAAQGYRAVSTVTSAVDRDGAANTEDLREIRVRVYNSDATRLYEDARVLLTFGGS